MLTSSVQEIALSRFDSPKRNGSARAVACRDALGSRQRLNFAGYGRRSGGGSRWTAYPEAVSEVSTA
jgi:hypothetical protein